KLKLTDSTQYFTADKRVVYGGGGITPDIFVPMDTLWNSKYYQKLVRTGSFNQFTLVYINDNRVAMQKKYPTADAYIKNFSIDDSLLQKFYAFAKDKKAEPDSAEVWSQSIPTIKSQLKGLIGQDLFNSSVYWQVTNLQNPIYVRALNAFTDGSFQKYKITEEKADKRNSSKKTGKLSRKRKDKKKAK
ncbi:MAG TPA: hypothetical protein PKO18_08195, partial [Chitinophagales bacterium]|nr:hypothetical protein [Chitinophagales bacterium]